jgi:hypothetical protein
MTFRRIHDEVKHNKAKALCVFHPNIEMTWLILRSTGGHTDGGLKLEVHQQARTEVRTVPTRSLACLQRSADSYADIADAQGRTTRHGLLLVWIGLEARPSLLFSLSCLAGVITSEVMNSRRTGEGTNSRGRIGRATNDRWSCTSRYVVRESCVMQYPAGSMTRVNCRT